MCLTGLPMWSNWMSVDCQASLMNDWMMARMMSSCWRQTIIHTFPVDSGIEQPSAKDPLQLAARNFRKIFITECLLRVQVVHSHPGALRNQYLAASYYAGLKHVWWHPLYTCHVCKRCCSIYCGRWLSTESSRLLHLTRGYQVCWPSCAGKYHIV